MGFGIVLLGYVLSMFDSFGGGIIGYPLMAYGFYRASRVNAGFRASALLSLAMMYDPVWQILILLKVMSGDSRIYQIAHVASFGIKLLLIISFYLGVREIARQGKSAKLERGAISRLYFNCVASLFMIVSAFVNFKETQIAINIAFIIAGIVNMLFLLDCASKITTGDRMAEEKRQLKAIDDEEKRKKEKRLQKQKEKESDEK